MGGGAPNGAGHVPAGEPEPPELVVWHELLDQRKELSLLKPDVCVTSSPPAASNVSRSRMPAASAMSSLRANPPELHVLDACLAEESRLRLDVPQQAGRCEGGTSCTHALLL